MLESSHNFYSKLQSSGNILLQRDDLGKKKPGIHNLPPAEFSYGKLSGEDKEGARDLIKTWKFHEKSPECKGEANFTLLNSMSAMKGLSTAPEFRTFRQGKKIVHQGQGKGNLLHKGKSAENLTYGLPLRPSTPIQAVISNFYGKLAVNNLNEIYGKTPELKTLRLSSTRGFELLKNSKILNKNETEKNFFKMKKFSKAKPRTSCWRNEKK